MVKQVKAKKNHFHIHVQTAQFNYWQRCYSYHMYLCRMEVKYDGQRISTTTQLTNMAFFCGLINFTSTHVMSSNVMSYNQNVNAPFKQKTMRTFIPLSCT